MAYRATRDAGARAAANRMERRWVGISSAGSGGGATTGCRNVSTIEAAASPGRWIVREMAGALFLESAFPIAGDVNGNWAIHLTEEHSLRGRLGLGACRPRRGAAPHR